ncbi:hypothetical protein P7K49_032581 [Saguinus oedipus]|uniref:UBA domain-containing protein n=1 Tax=Saguinus oedipus TaxID=9490 RepID=A0ABQ9TYM6_SAGOE|nr:hypothetical protein P7K49_032581 [Saguinus oedipus]
MCPSGDTLHRSCLQDPQGDRDLWAHARWKFSIRPSSEHTPKIRECKATPASLTLFPRMGNVTLCLCLLFCRLKALAATGRKTAEEALAWLHGHCNDPSLDDPIPQEYALFLCPTGPLLEKLQEFWRESKRQCAKNRAHEVFPHVTLCDFFTRQNFPGLREQPSNSEKMAQRVAPRGHKMTQGTAPQGTGKVRRMQGLLKRKEGEGGDRQSRPPRLHQRAREGHTRFRYPGLTPTLLLAN